uniref:Endonuclease/exonuclease/phosphatase domain-containing protein n=1 Tax=Sander lucioperca TaxID=283035 RepID=A0A8D0CXD8_SANLU
MHWLHMMKVFSPRLTNELLSLNEYSLIIGGDMNAVLDLNQDRSGVNHTKAQKRISDMFKAVVEFHHLTDIWRMHNPTSKDYTFFSTHHLTHSCIDYMLLAFEHPNLAQYTLNVW